MCTDQIQELILLDSNSIFNQAASILNLPEELAQHLENLLHNFVSLVLDVFFNACADLSELHHIVELLFPKYLQPIVTDGGEYLVYTLFNLLINPLL